ncbi:MAG: hypothetical protein ACREV9_12235 [Burkholderiales bacterium]
MGGFVEVVGVALLVFGAYKMPMLWRRSKIRVVLSHEYQYEFSPLSPQAYTLNKLERETRGKGLNEYELASLFMAVMVSSLFSNGPDVKQFVRKVRSNVDRLRYGSNAISSEIHAQVAAVLENKLS